MDHPIARTLDAKVNRTANQEDESKPSSSKGPGIEWLSVKSGKRLTERDAGRMLFAQRCQGR